jgi:hypothetical protein
MKNNVMVTVSRAAHMSVLAMCGFILYGLVTL